MKLKFPWKRDLSGSGESEVDLKSLKEKLTESQQQAQLRSQHKPGQPTLTPAEQLAAAAQDSKYAHTISEAEERAKRKFGGKTKTPNLKLTDAELEEGINAYQAELERQDIEDAGGLFSYLRLKKAEQDAEQRLKEQQEAGMRPPQQGQASELGPRGLYPTTMTMPITTKSPTPTEDTSETDDLPLPELDRRLD